MSKTVNLIKLSSFLLGLMAIGISSCNKEPEYVPVSYNSTAIEEFWLEKTVSNPNLNRPYQAMVMGDSAIHLLVDYGTDITAIEPTIIAYADSIRPTGKQNFSNPVQYTVWANGKSVSYTVRISVSTIPFPVIKTIAAGYSHVVAIKNDGTVWVCGSNFSGQLGLGDYSSRNVLTQVPIYNAEQVYTGDAATVIKLKDGTTWATGNQYGQLGFGHRRAIATFTRHPFLDDAKQIAITFGEMFVLKTDGTVWGAGRNFGNILAQPDSDPRASFVKVPIDNIISITGNGSDIVGQKNNGEIWGWGNNTGGILGVGDNLPRKTPVQLPIPSINVTKIIAGGSTLFLMDDAGKVWGSGANASGQLGLGDLTNRYSFTQLSFFDNKSIETIIPHLGATSYIENNGTIWNAGSNLYGLMGLGSISSTLYTTPVQLPNFVAKMSTGNGNIAYALKADGTLWAWGSNSAGGLGTGTDITNSGSPIQIK